MPFELVIVTPEGQAFHAEVESVVLPGTEGDFGVLTGHEPFLTGLRIGAAELHRGGAVEHAALSRGYARVEADGVTVLVGSCEFAEDIDRDRAELARERAERQLRELRETAEGEELYQRYQDAFSRALTRLAVSEKQRQFRA